MWRSRLFWRLFGTYGLLLLAAIVGLGAVVGDRVERQYHQQLQERLRNKTLLVRELVHAYEHLTPAELADSLSRLRDEGLPRITLIDAAGLVLLDTEGDAAHMSDHANRPEIVDARASGFGVSTRPSPTTDKTYAYAALRVPVTRHGVGYVRIAVLLDSIEEELAALRSLVRTTAAVTGVLAMALAFWLARRIALPIQDLTESAASIAAGDYGRTVYAGGAEEVRVLARAFNHMSERLASQFAQLDEERQQLRAILSGMIEGVVALDADQRILFVNDRALTLLDLAGQRVIGRTLGEVVHHRGVTDLVTRALAESEPRREELTWSGPPPRDLTAHAARLQGAVARGAVVVLHDTTELRRLERLRQDFVANVSHELKTPLSVIQACVETLLDGAADDVAHRGAFLERIGEQSSRLYNLILDLLSLARVESGGEAFSLQPIEVAEAVAACLRRHRTRAESKQQHLTAECQGAAVAWADEEAVGQILDNLVDNALKYTQAGGTIRVVCRVDGDQVALDVEDTGIGIPERDLPRIFERFYRVDKARSRELGGTGLGLSIVKHLAQAMRGSASATSTPGKGSTFHVRLPRAPSA